MRIYKNIKRAVEELALDHETKPLGMLIETCKDPVFKKPMEEAHYSLQWLKHHLYLNPNINVFKKLVSVFPTKHDFKIDGYENDDGVFLADKG